jgi:hypothetical protein
MKTRAISMADWNRGRFLDFTATIPDLARRYLTSTGKSDMSVSAGGILRQLECMAR